MRTINYLCREGLMMALVALLVSSTVNAQPPETMSYQAVIRNSSNNLVTNTAIGMKISILQGSVTGAAVYVEQQTPTTNASGLVALEIGSGTPVFGTLGSISWIDGPFFIKTETDITGGSNYTIIGTSQLLSVPYALLAKTATTADYNALSNKPELFDGQYSNLSGLPALSTVATSGSYTDLTNKPPILNSQWTTSGSNIYYSSGSVGIGTTTPSAKLEVTGQVKVTGGTPALGEVLTTDGTGLATWEPIPVPAINHICFEVKREASYDWPTNASVQKVDFSSNSTVWENQGNAFNQTSSTFTAPENGIYAFTGAVYFSGIATGCLIYVYLQAGGKNYNGNWRYASGSSEIVNLSMTLYLSRYETVQLWGYVNDPTPPATVYGNTAAFAFTYFSGAKVR